MVPQDTTMLEMLVIFQQRRRNIAFISRAKRTAIQNGELSNLDVTV